MSDESPQRSNLNLAASLVAIVIGMTLMAYASVPLYKLFCRVTGVGGTTQIAKAAPERPLDRVITVRFNTDVAPDLPWAFTADQKEVRVRIGEQKLVSFTARNTTASPLAGTAVFNVTPYDTGVYFNKIQCFCFNQQTIAPGATAHFPVSFFIDPALVKDPNIGDLDTITLSYTFFKVEPSK